MRIQAGGGMGNRVLLVRGGKLPVTSGFGRAHNATLQRLESGLVSGWEIIQEVNHTLDDVGPLRRVRRRWFTHPKKVKNAILNTNPDLIHITDQEQAHLVPKNISCPVVITVHDLFLLDPKVLQTNWGPIEIGNQNPGIIRSMDINRLKRGLSQADLAICISKKTAEHLAQLIPNIPVEIVPNSVDVEARDPRIKLRERPELDSDSTHLLVVGSEDPRKAIEFVLDVIGELDPKIRQNIILHKVGAESNPNAELRLRERAEQLRIRLKWHGKVDEEKLIALEQHVDALLFPSAAEGFGLPVVEAMASGCPVLVNDLGAQNEHPPDSCILPPFDISSWKNAILNINNDRISRGSDNRAPREDLIVLASIYSVKQISVLHSHAYSKALELKK